MADPTKPLPDRRGLSYLSPYVLPVLPVQFPVSPQCRLQALQQRPSTSRPRHDHPDQQGRHETAGMQWVEPGLIGRVKHLRGEEALRHASLQDFREDGE